MARKTWGSDTGAPLAVHLTVTETDVSGTLVVTLADAGAAFPLYLDQATTTPADDFLLWDDGLGYATPASSITVTAAHTPPAFQGPDGVEVLYTADGLAILPTDSAATWSTMSGKPAVIAAGDDAAEARDAIDAAPTASPVLTGTPVAPTPAAGDSSTRLATTAFVAGGAVAQAAAATGGLVRDADSDVAASFLELVDSGSGVTVYGVDRETGAVIVNGQPRRVPIYWYPGDADPTANGFDAQREHVVLRLGVDDTVPAWATTLAESVPVTVEQETGATGAAPVFQVQWDGIGLTDEAAITVGTAGTGDTPITAIHAGSPTVEGTGVPAGFPTGARMVEFDPTAGQCAFYWTVASGTERRLRGFLRTPATLATLVLAGFKDGGAECGRLILGSNGAVRLSNSSYTVAMASAGGVFAASSDYYIEVALTQDTPATDSVMRAWVFDSSGAQQFDSGDIVDPGGVGFGTTHDEVWAGHFGSGTGGVFYGGRYRVTGDAATAIPGSA